MTPTLVTHKPIAITMGDPAGIGPEIIVKAFTQAPDVMSNCFVAGDVAAMQRAAGLVDLVEGAIKIEAILEHQICQLPAYSGLRVLQINERYLDISDAFRLGTISATSGQAAAATVIWAARAALNGQIAALVTAPLHKEALHAAGVAYPGHTELLQAESAAFLGKSIEDVPVRMMLANDDLRTVLVSIHMSLRDAIAAVTYENVLATIRITHGFLQRTFAKGSRQKIGVAGLNPHAGEGGLFGMEEIDVIAPAVQAAQNEGIEAVGPFAPDTIFMRARSKELDGKKQTGEFDAVIAMYHDQGLIPVKYLGVEQGVNVTLGLPLIRTSPDHGTAFDIAGKGIADPASLIAAVKMAKRLANQP